MAEIKYSHRNHIYGWFERYGVFSMRLPLIPTKTDNKNIFLGLCPHTDDKRNIDEYVLVDKGGAFACETDNAGILWTNSFALDLAFTRTKRDDRQGYKRVKIIIPIVQNDIQLVDTLNGRGVDSFICYVSYLAYSLNDGCFIYAQFGQSFVPTYKPGFDYKIKCVGEYKWKGFDSNLTKVANV